MPSRVKLKIGPTGLESRVKLDGVELANCYMARLTIKPGQLSTLELGLYVDGSAVGEIGEVIEAAKDVSELKDSEKAKTIGGLDAWLTANRRAREMERRSPQRPSDPSKLSR